MKMSANDNYKNSLDLYTKAKEFFPFGTQLFSRRPELGPFGQAPVYFERAKDAHFWDIDGNEFIDTFMAVGPIILGYCYDEVDNAVKAQIAKGVLGSVNSPLEIEMAQLIVDMVPCAEMIRFCKSGGEANAIAVRIARGYTGKDIVLFCGYHGWHDWYLAANLKSQSNLNEHLMPGINPKGVPSALAGTAVPFEYNKPDSLADTLKKYRGQVACIIMEATRHKHPQKGYLEAVRQLADENECLLIFDEVVTGFRIAAGGAEEYYGVTADLVTFGKAIANGYPLAAVAGKRNIMALQADNFISSTYWSDTVSLAAGIATLNQMKEKPVIETLHSVGRTITDGLEQSAKEHNLRVEISGHPYCFSVSFDYEGLFNKIMTLYMQEMAARGIYVSSAVYTCFTHTQQDIDKILAAADDTFAVMAKGIKENNIDNLLKCEQRKVGFRRLV